MNNSGLIICRGGGDLATGIAYRLKKAGFQVLVLEIERPAAIRRQVSFCQAVYDGEIMVEDVIAKRIRKASEWADVSANGMIPVLVDPEGVSIEMLRPEIVIDAILAKKNLGTKKEMAPLVIGVGPGFVAGEDVHVVIETKRGHSLGRVIWSGAAAINTGVPGLIEGYGKERVLHAPVSGRLSQVRRIGDIVEAGEVIACITEGQKTVNVPATISGVLRGLIQEGYEVEKGLKIADIDPRIEEQSNCFTISDKARCISGGVLEAVCHHFQEDYINE